MIACAFGSAGCVGDAPQVGAQRRDSSGVTIVEISDPTTLRAESWSADSVVLTLGTVDGAGPELFDGVTGLLIGGARLVVGDAGSGELRWFTRSGEHLTSVGRRGEGPGEFVTLPWIGAGPEGEIIAWDWNQRRLTTFRDGVRLSDLRLDGSVQDGTPAVEAVLPDGRVVLTRTPTLLGESGDGVQRAPVMVGVLSRDGSDVDSLAVSPGRALYRESAGEGRWRVGIVPFGPRTLVAVAGGQVVVGDNARYELRYVNPDGSLERIVRMAVGSRPVLEPDVDRAREQRLASLPPIEEVRAAVAALFDATPAPDSMPAFAALVGDRSGRIWVRRSESDGAWDVFGADGMLLARAVLPARFELQDVEADLLLGVETDDLGVERVVLRRVRCHAPATPCSPGGS